MDGEVERWTDIRIDRETERYEDGKTYGWTDRCRHGQMKDRQIYSRRKRAIHKHLTWMKRLARDKHSTLLRYEYKKF